MYCSENNRSLESIVLKRGLYFLTLFWAVWHVVGCSFIAKSTSILSHDGPPARDVDTGSVADAVPRLEAITRAGNRSPYTVLGKTYRINFNPQDFSEVGLASWYGTKFHGNPTANGERYDMFAMTAAHKTLPIPSYVRVTNLNNGRQVVVRVNDRGPFHDRRVIDLSYVAAKKLDMLQSGTAKVKVELVTPERPTVQSVQKVGTQSGAMYLQVGAFSQAASADALRARLAAGLPYSVQIQHEPTRDLHKVLVGPFHDEQSLPSVRAALQAQEVHEAHLVQR